MFSDEYKCVLMSDYNRLLTAASVLIAINEHLDLQNLLSNDDRAVIVKRANQLLNEADECQ